MHILLIHNPVSGLRKFRNTAQVIRDFLSRRDIDFTWFETVFAPSQPLGQFDFKKFDRVIVSGGDGTVAQVAHFLIANKIKIPLGIIAQGSGDVLAMSLGIPVFPLERALEFALEKDARALDAMKVNRTRYALIAAGQGYDAHFIKNATRRLKRVLGIFAYGVSFLKTFFGYRHNAYKLIIDGRKYYALGKSVMVLNVFSIIGIHIDSAISPRDGVLNALVLNPYSIWDVLWMAILSIFRYPVARIPKIQAFTGKKISIKAKREKRIHIDGEIFHGRNLQIEVIPDALNVVYDPSHLFRRGNAKQREAVFQNDARGQHEI